MGRKAKPSPVFAIVKAEKQRNDCIAYTVSMEYNSNTATRRAETLAGDRYGSVAVAVIDWTGCKHWNQGRRIAYFGEVEL